MATKIPKQYRLTFKAQEEMAYDEKGNLIPDGDGGYVKIQLPRLAFATEYNPQSSAYAKREQTQDQWAYGDRWGPSVKTPTYFMRDGKMWKNRRSWDKQPDNTHVERWTESVVEDSLQPIIIDNVALEGFRIQHSVSRCTTSNKLWRILDPRGFELEINTGTMEEIIMGGVIDHGLIVGPCIWKTSKMLERV